MSQTTLLTAFTRFKIFRPPENVHSKETEGSSGHVCFQESDEGHGDLSPPRKCFARDDCDIVTIGILHCNSLNLMI